jgi:valyl-tRNA synthetase
MEIPSKFISQEVEDKWYSFWMEKDFFSSNPDAREPYTIVIPPPNVTGVLHMGHMLNNTLQDIIIRRARMQGYNACWVPGTDHASIATEAKVVARLKEQGIEKSSLSREDFLKHAWDWTEEYGGVILEQLKKLGCSCDWKRTKFTLDEDMSASVIDTFVKLYDKGLIYRGYRMVNWDPEAKTTLSDEEVIYEERAGQLYHIAYKLEDSDESLIIATTRPETLLGDTAVCVHPDDERYAHLKGKQLIVPIANRVIPIIQDTYVDREFGTGCLKVTPAHDVNDRLLGEKHHLEVIDIFNEDATLNHHGLAFEGMDRFVARKAIVKALESSGHLVKKESYRHKVGTSERTKAVIEPRLSDQWFLKMEGLAAPAIKSVLEDGDIRLVPEKFKNTYRHWMENIRDWNISRQLWWGQQIPAYYYGKDNSQFVVAKDKTAALAMAKAASGNNSMTPEDLRQDEDVLDTWFSSWLWPISVFNGVLEPDNPEINYYYPTQDLVTGPDILFFWVARMIMSGFELLGQKPFSNVYLTGLVRDKQGRKMSKQLGNSPDALALIENYGADAVRVGLMLSAAAGNDLLFDESLCQQGKNFANKIWNAFRLVQGWPVDDKLPTPDSNTAAIEWYKNLFYQNLEVINDHFEKYRISDALMALYKLIWDDFCSWFLEMIKPKYGEPVDRVTLEEVKALFELNLKLLHPFMPFLSEELWHHISDRGEEEALVVAAWPQSQQVRVNIIEDFERVKQIVAGIRNFRKEKNISFKEELTLVSQAEISCPSLVQKLGQLESIVPEIDLKQQAMGSFRVGQSEFFIPLKNGFNPEEELKKLRQELEYAKGFLASVEKKLSNERFVSNAPQQVIDMERKKASDAQKKIALLEKNLSQL